MDIDVLKTVPGKYLKKKLDRDLDDIEIEGTGTTYDDLLQQLQIRPESCQLFFEKNLRQFRNKKPSLKLIARGDDASLRKLTDNFLTGFGNLIWTKNRGWLLEKHELHPSEAPLRYVPPKDRQDGDNDIFYTALEQLWRRMRNIIHELKDSHSQPASEDSPQTKSTQLNPARPETHMSKFSAEIVPVAPLRTSIQFTNFPDAQVLVQELINIPSTSSRTGNTEPRFINKWKVNSNRFMMRKEDGTYDRTLPRLRAHAQPINPNEYFAAGYWPASRTQEAIINIIVDLHETRINSYPPIFEQAFEENMARLEEWIEEDRLAEETWTMKDTERDPENEDAQSDDLTLNDDTDFEDAMESIPTLSNGKPVSKSVITTAGAAIELSSENHEARSFVDAHRPTSPTCFPLSALSPSVLPHIMCIHITPFRVPPSSSNVQPYIWPEAPIQAHQYQRFMDGVRLRANVPDSVGNDRLMVVLGYGWNDFSRLIRGEQDWTNGVMADLRDASRRLNVRVWRARCCVFTA